MSAVATALLLPFTLISIACIVLFCDEHSPACFGPLHYLFAIAVPHGLKKILNVLPGGPLMLRCCGSSYDYVFNKPNPLMQIFFLGLVIGGFAIYVHFGLPLIPNSRVGWMQIPISFAGVLWVIFTFVLASVAPPGYVTPHNAEALERIYPYDGFLFVKSTCSTCGTPKVARSKHCRMLGKCVEKYDHFCPWINNCVGALNYKYFLLFVGSTAAFLCYGTWVLGSLILFVIERDNLWNVKFMHSSTNQVMDADWRIVSQYMISQHGMLLFVLVLCSVMALTLVGFFVYQLYLISIGRTANENAKWADIHDLYHSTKWRREVEAREAGEIQSLPDNELIHANSAPLSDRLLKDFPRRAPAHVYNKGFLSNLKQVVLPDSAEARKQISAVKRATATGTGGNATAGGAAVVSTAASSATNGTPSPSKPATDSKKTGKGSNKKNKKKD